MLDNKLKKITDIHQISSQLQQVKNQQHECYIWRFVGEKKVLAKVHVTILRRSRKEIVIRADEHEKELYSLVVGVLDEVNFYIPNSAIMFRCSIVHNNFKGELTLSYPGFVAQIERRRFPRLNTYRNDLAKSFFSKCIVGHKIQTQYFQKTLFDLSAGGFSLVVSKMELSFFNVGDQIPDMELIFEGRKMNANAQVVHVQPLEPQDNSDIIYKVWKVSFKFTAILSRDFEFLSRHIFEKMTPDQEAV
jgi:c-di-GMP-binding flagellar brake protein YcgR